MKRNHSIMKMVAVLCAIMLSVTSCLKEETNKNLQFSGLFTILGSYPSYKLLDDGGNSFFPTVESVNALTSSKGFGSNKRIYLYGTYTESDVKMNSDSTHTISNAILTGGTYVLTTNVLSLDEAKDANILSNDSIFDIQRINNCWIANGYLTTSINGQYSSDGKNAILPTTNAMVDSKNISENAIIFTLLYNRHSVKTTAAAGAADFLNSFDLTGINIPGSDSVNVQINVQGADPIKFKVARKFFKAIR